MFISLLLILLVTIGGTILTYLCEKDDSLLVRVGAGNVIGSAIFGTVTFLFASLFGFSTVTIIAALMVTLLPIMLLIDKSIHGSFASNIGKFEGVTVAKFLNFFYYLSILILLAFFFDRAMFETNDGIFTGASNNLGDLPFHLGAIFSFTEGNVFPPENPSFAGAKFTYPFLVDLIVASFVKLGVNVTTAMFWQNIALAFSLVVLFEKFTVAMTKNRLAGKLAPVIFLLSGGLGFVLFFRDYWADGRSIFEYIWHLEKDYTIKSELLRWGNSLIVLLITQRGFLLGMPIMLVVLTHLWKVFATDDTESTVSAKHPRAVASLIIGLLAGMLPLIHVHSLFALFIVAAFLFFFDSRKIKDWLIFGAGVSIIAVPELIWSLTGSATNLSKFIGWHWGWDKGNTNFLAFWGANLGLFIPLLVIGLLLKSKHEELPASHRLRVAPSLLFYIPFGFIFLLCNTVKLAPWEWDNIKVLVYWFVASVPFAAWVLAHFWQKTAFFKIAVLASLIILTLSGGLDVWRVVSRQIDNYQVFSADAVKIAAEIRVKTEPNALFLNAPTYNSAVVLSGRRSLMRYVGHLSSYGIDYADRENEVKRMYEGSTLAFGFFEKEKVEYVIVSPEEKSYMAQNKLQLEDKFFEKYSKIAEVGEYKVYKIK